MKVAKFAAAILLFATTFAATPAMADSWLPPQTKTYESGDTTFRLTVVPRELSSQLEYFSDAVDGKTKPGQQAGSSQVNATGRLERREGRRWVSVWYKSLINDVAPVDAVVANSGRYVATLDNWHFMGGGDNVVVFYGADGR